MRKPGASVRWQSWSPGPLERHGAARAPWPVARHFVRGRHVPRITLPCHRRRPLLRTARFGAIVANAGCAPQSARKGVSPRPCGLRAPLRTRRACTDVAQNRTSRGHAPLQCVARGVRHPLRRQSDATRKKRRPVGRVNAQIPPSGPSHRRRLAPDFHRREFG